MTNNSTDLVNQSVTGSAHLDLAGNLIIKARFNNNFKKTTINNDELTYDELILMLQRLFNGRFDAKDDVKLKYRDEDGDLVDIDNDSDLKSAIQSNRYLKLVIYLGDDCEDDVSLLDDKISLSKKEFRKLTDTMERILESLRTNEPVKPENSTNSSFEPLNNEPQVAHTLNNLTLSDSKEFDPLVNKSEDLKSDKSNVQASLGDDSIKSLSSANERQPATLQPSAQQFQSTQNLQSKILNQSQQFQPPTQTNQSQQFQPQTQTNQQQQFQPPTQSNQPPQFSPHGPPQQQQQQQQQNQPPYRYGMPPSSSNQPPISRPSTFNPNELPNQPPPQFNPSSHPPSSYPTPSSTPANTFQPPQMTSPPGPQLSGPPSFNPPFGNPPMSGPPMSGPPSLSGPPTSMNTVTSPPPNSNIQSGPPSAFGPPPTNQPPQMNRPGPPMSGPPMPSHLQQQQQPPQSTNLPPNGPPTSMPNTSQNGIMPATSTQPLQAPPQFTNFLPPTGPYPGQQAPKSGNPFGRNTAGSRGYVYPQQQFN